jgi:two-component system response regulator HydG
MNEPDQKPRILLIEDDPDGRLSVSEALSESGYEVTAADCGLKGVELFGKQTFDAVLSDIKLPDIDGIQVLTRILKSEPEMPVLLMTAFGTITAAVEALKAGAYDYILKPLDLTDLQAKIAHAIETQSLRRQVSALKQELFARPIIAKSKQMLDVLSQIRTIAPTAATVLVLGESGTGKELIAQAIHQNSPRKNKRVVPLNARAVSENLVESELFGHVKGAFTDAVTDRVGAFEYADGGTLFLDEVGDMPMSTQIKLLRVLEEHQITRVGDHKPIKVNVRLVSATNRNLEETVERGEFRRDLYYRIKVVTVQLPSLRERREDIMPLVDHFRKQFAKRHGNPVKNISPAVSRKLFSYDWPGNVRQLRNAVETMVVLDMDGLLDVDDLPPEMEDIPEPQGTFGDGPSNLIGQPLSEIERWAIEQTLKLTNGNREETARILGIGARTLYRKLDKYQG